MKDPFCQISIKLDCSLENIFLAHQVENSAFFISFNKAYFVNLYQIKV